MDKGIITRSLIDCLNGDEIDSKKFFATHPWNDSLKKSLYQLRNLGYIIVDEGENRILEIAPTQKLLELAKATH